MSRFNQPTDEVEMRELLSALVDGELSPQETEALLDALQYDTGDRGLRHTWAAIHRARAVVQASSSREKPVQPSAGFLDRVESALEQEPTVMAPGLLLPPELSAAQSAEGNASLGKVGQSRVWAMAAAVLLAVGLVSFSGYFGQNTHQGGELAGQSAPEGPFSEVESLSQSQAAELEALVVEHGEFTGMAALNGLLAYAKVVNQQVGR